MAVPISRSTSLPKPAAHSSAHSSPAKPQDWTYLVAAGAVVAGGALMVTGHRRAGLVIAAAGTALSLLEEPEVITTWWKNLPEYLHQAQDFLDKIEEVVDEATIQGKRIQGMLKR